MPEASAIQLLPGSVGASILVGCTAYACYRLAWALVHDGTPLLRLAAMATIGGWLATVGFHLLFALSLFQLPAAVVVTMLLASLASRLPRNRSTHSLLAEDWRSLRTGFDRDVTTAEGFLLYVGASTAALLFLRALVVPPMAWDWLTYHGVRSALFVKNADWTLPVAPGTWSLYRHFFAGSEVLDAWPMLPFHSDVLVSLCSWVQWLIFGAAAAALAEALGLSLRMAVVSGIAVLLIPTALASASSGYAENALGASTLAALAFALRFVRHARTGLAALVFAASGLAFGIKLTAILPVAVACIAVVVAASVSRRHRRRGAVLSLALGVALVLLPALPWLLIAYRDTGYPLSPMPVSLLGLRLGVASPEMELVGALDTGDAYTLEGELAVLEGVFANPERFTLGPLSLIPILLIPLAVFRNASRREWLILGISVSAMLAVVASYYHPGLAAVRLHWSGNSSRFLINLVALAIPFGFGAFQAGSRAARTYVWALAGSAFFHSAWASMSGSADHEGAGLLQAALLVILVGGAAGWTWRHGLLGRMLAVLVCSASILGIDALQRTNRPDALAYSFHLHWSPRYWYPAALGLDQSQPRRIAVTSGTGPGADHWFTYPLLGSRLQNELTYVPISSDGRIVLIGPGVRLESHGDERRWVERVLSSGITDVVSFEPRSIEMTWMQRRPGLFKRRGGDERWAWYEVLRTGAAR